jgi:hypothetical protein
LRRNSARRAPRSNTPTEEAIRTSNQVSSIAGPEYKILIWFSIKEKVTIMKSYKIWPPGRKE